MAPGFLFGFKSDDLDDEADDLSMPDEEITGLGQSNLTPARLHTLDEMLATFPSSLSYTTHGILDTLRLPRRELSDIRAQLLAETDVLDSMASALTEGLTSDDIKPGMYEGGFKTWECSIDLARLVADQFQGIETDLQGGSIVELGAGTALPSCTMLHGLLNNPGDESNGFVRSTKSKLRTIVIADYNEHVLTHASIPNMFLTYVESVQAENISRPSEAITQHDVEVTEELKQSFKNRLAAFGLQIVGISGSWGTEFCALARPFLTERPSLILASETIYQPDSLEAFTSTLVDLQGSSAQASLALIAAKKVYFGVGGGIDEFKACLHRAKGRAEQIWDSGDQGVGRVVLRILNG